MAKQISLPKPYSVPSNWCWTNMGEIVSMKTGFPFDSNRFSRESDEKRPLIRIRDVLKGETETFTDEPCPDQYVVHAGEILIGMDGDFNVAKWKSEDALLNQRVCAIQTSSKLLLNDYLYYYLPDILKKINDATPSVTVKHLSTKTLDKTPIPVAPLTEQQRIVDRIENLFAKLDEAKGKAQAVVDGFETRKAAILHKAFTGDLTAKWRQENNLASGTWGKALFDDCVLKMQNGLAKRSGTNGVPLVVLRLANLSDDGFITDDLREIVLDEKEQLNYELKQNDVIMIRVNGSKDNVGKQFLITNQKNWAFCDHIIRIVYKENVHPEFMIYFSKSEQYRLYIKENMVSSAGQNTISRKGMSKLVVPLPTLAEQKEIVRTLDNLIGKEQQAKEAAEAVLDRIETMKKAILASAFRGELGTNDPTEESAVELLKQVLKT